MIGLLETFSGTFSGDWLMSMGTYLFLGLGCCFGVFSTFFRFMQFPGCFRIKVCFQSISDCFFRSFVSVVQIFRRFLSLKSSRGIISALNFLGATICHVDAGPSTSMVQSINLVPNLSRPPKRQSMVTFWLILSHLLFLARGYLAVI